MPSILSNLGLPPLLNAPIPAVPPPAEPERRAFTDPQATRNQIYDKVLTQVKNIGPLTNARHTLELHNAEYIDSDHIPIQKQKEAILTGKSLSRRIKGTWRLTDNATGNVLDEQKMTIAQVPHMTQRGTFVVNGTEYSLSNQMRLRPGIFTRVKENGEIESHVNVMPGNGISHRYFLDPETGVFKINIGQAKLPLLPVVKALGVKDSELRKAWGDELLAINAQVPDARTVSKLYQRLVRKPNENAPDEEKVKTLADLFNSMKLDPEVTKRTLGTPHEFLTKDAILDTTKKLIAVSKKEQEPDDRDHLAYQTLHGPEDLLAERITKDRTFLRQLLWKASLKGNLSSIQPGVLTKQLQHTLLNTGLGNPVEEINTAELLDNQSRTTRLGEGGIASMDAVPDESRNVSNSQFGFIDSVRTPESGKVGIDTRITGEARKGKDGRIYAPFINVKTGQTEYKSPQDITDAAIAFPGELAKGQPYVAAQQGGAIRFIPREAVAYEMPHFENAFSPLANMIPIKSALKGQRMAMGARYLAQALPMPNREAPYLQAALPGRHLEKSFEDQYGTHMGALRANADGIVKKVTPDAITVNYNDGSQETHELYNNFPFSRKSVSGDTVIFIKRNTTQFTCKIKDYVFTPGDMTLSIDPVTYKSAYMPVTGYTSHQNTAQLLRITTDSGRSFVVTKDHSLIVLGDDGNLIPAYPTDCIINFTRLPVATIPLQDNKDFSAGIIDGYLAGLYLSEGHCPPTHPSLVMIAVQPDNRADEVLWHLRELGYKPYRDGGSVCFTDHDVADVLRTHFGHLSHNKRIPSWVLNTSIDYRRKLIAGYMAGDGCLHYSSGINIAAVSVSQELRDGLVDILSSLGIFTTLFNTPRNHLNQNWRDGFGFRVTNSTIHKMPRWFFYTDRERKLREFTPVKYRSSKFEVVPVPNKTTRQLLYAGFEAVPPYIYKTAHFGAVAKHRIKHVNGPYGKWANSDVNWDLITTIEPSDEESIVYDLSIAGSEMFAVNHGVIVHNTFCHNEPVVQPGQRITKDALLATSNYTDNKGTTALGLNARIAMIPWHSNYEDAAIVSESMAKRMTSEHMYQHDQDWEPNIKKGLKPFISLFPTAYEKPQLLNMDEQGVIKPGTEVKFGDPLVLVASQREDTHSQIHHGRKPTFVNKTLTWEHHTPGIVTDVAHTGKGTTVAIKAHVPMEVGDKISNRWGGKGIISEILPDEQMPQDANGKSFEIALNPLGMISRINPVQIHEMVLGKIANKTGQPYKIEDFSKINDLVDFVKKERDKHGIKDTETITDPATGHQIPNILTGHQYMLKLQHTAESKGQGRGIGAYTSEDVPSRGGDASAKKIGMLETNALLSHGSTEFLRDAHVIRGQRNDNYWQQFMSGYRPPEPEVPRIYQKFVDSMRAGGINVVRHGRQLHVMALADKDVKQLAGDRSLRNTDTVDWKEGLKPKPGGLFDPSLTGGHGGNRWAKIDLHEPLPNPAFEEPIRRILGLTQAKFEDVIAGQHSLANYGTGPQAISDALNDLKLKKEIVKASAEAKGSKKTIRDEALRKLKYLKDADRLGIHPKDWIMSSAPVIPPIYRPISVLAGSGNQQVGDANYLYKELFNANDLLRDAKKAGIGDVSHERSTVYKALKGVVGLGEPVTAENVKKGVKGVLKHVFGDQPKLGMMQRQLLGTSVELVGRAVIAPNPDFDMDQVGLPENKAWDVYKPFVIRRLVQHGVPRLEAARAFIDQSPLARDALVSEMNHRPVVISRAPTLHRYGIMGAWPKLIKGNVMQIPPIVTKGYGADFDGDQMNYHVPASEEARKEVIDKMLPSRNLLAAANFQAHYVPTMEYQGGLYHATTAKNDKSRPQIFATKEDALRAYHEGRLSMDSPVEVVKH